MCLHGKEDNVGIVDLDELQEIGEDNLLRPLKPLLALIEDLDAGNLPGKVWISGHLHSQDAQGLKSGRETGFVSIAAREQVLLARSVDPADVHVVKLGGIAGLDLDLLGYFPAGIDPVALESAEDAIEAALFDLNRLSRA